MGFLEGCQGDISEGVTLELRPECQKEEARRVLEEAAAF